MMQLTSQLAFAEIRPKIGGRQALVLKVLGKNPPMTNRELKEVLGWDINTVTPRVNELVKAGLVEFVERRPCKITGRSAIAWTVAN